MPCSNVVETSQLHAVSKQAVAFHAASPTHRYVSLESCPLAASGNPRSHYRSNHIRPLPVIALDPFDESLIQLLRSQLECFIESSCRLCIIVSGRAPPLVGNRCSRPSPLRAIPISMDGSGQFVYSSILDARPHAMVMADHAANFICAASLINSFIRNALPFQVHRPVLSGPAV